MRVQANSGKATECGSITSVAISADHAAVAGGHSTGNILVWQLEKPKTPFLHITPVDRIQISEKNINGHVEGSAVLHVGFLGTKQTALATADDKGMAFSHFASHGLGALGRSYTTTRILGRYSPIKGTVAKSRKASSVLALAPLPLGNIERATDVLGLTAILTPYLLVIVSTTPIAQTQHKAPRPKELAPHSALSGCLAWFPAVKLKVASGTLSQPVSRTKLVYCWSNILTILEIDEPDHEDVQGKEASTSLHFHPRSRWKSPEAIVAVQWLSRSVIGVLTVSQRLIILEDNTMRVTDSYDMIHKHVFHEDLFSRQLQSVVDQLDQDEIRLHGVVADAFYMSFRAYKSRLFILGFNDVAVGILSNWADRLMALMHEGNVMSAIHLATMYYDGKGDKVTVGLSEDDSLRQPLVKERLLGIIVAASKLMLRKFYEGDYDNTNGEEIRELTKITIASCISMNEIDFYFEEVYDLYDASAQDIILETFGSRVLSGDLTSFPPSILKDLITHYTEIGNTAHLEEIICRLDTSNMDIHQVSELCKKHRLYDALIYVWNQALQDYITPLIELLDIINHLTKAGEPFEQGNVASATRLFPYLAYTLTGRRYPDGRNLSESNATKAKGDIYAFLFSGNPVEWPKGSGKIYLAESERNSDMPYPYLRLILHFDTSSFMSMLNEAFEDSFLNGESDANDNNSSTHQASIVRGSGFVPTRQYIVSILLDIMFSGEFEKEDTIFFDMFIARNLPKFPQFILLSGSSLKKVLVDLCNNVTDDVAEECQLSVEYLLSVFRSSEIETLVPLFEEARFYRVLKSIYRKEKRYSDLIRTYFNDKADILAVFECIEFLLRPSTHLTRRNLLAIKNIIKSHAQELVQLDPARTATIVGIYSKDLLVRILDNVEDGSWHQFALLKAVMEPKRDKNNDMVKPLDLGNTMTEKYVRLMCKFDPVRVADFVNGLKSGNLHLDQVIPAMEESGVVDAAVVLMARDGLTRRAMDRLVAHIGTLTNALKGLLEAARQSPDKSNTKEAAEDLLHALDKNCTVGIWLCKGQTGGTERQERKRDMKRQFTDNEEADLAPFELLWLDLLDAIVSTSTVIAVVVGEDHDNDLTSTEVVDKAKVVDHLRALVQKAFTALLVTTSTTAKSSQQKTSKHSHPTFLHILRAFLTRTSRATPSLSDLQAILTDIFSAYTFEETMLSIANEFLDNDLYSHVAEAKRLRERGWRSRSQTCETCKRRAWGMGAGGDIWDAWERKLRADEASRVRHKVERGGGEAARRLARGKSKAEADDLTTMKTSEENRREGSVSAAGDGSSAADVNEMGSLVLFACRHMFHRGCLAKATEKSEMNGRNGRGAGHAERSWLYCPLC